MYDGASENSDVIYYSEDSLSDAESISLKESVPTPTDDSSWCFEDDIISGISTQECPLNSRNRYVGCTLFSKASSVDSDKDDRCVKSKFPKTSKVSTGSTQLGKRG